MIINAKLPLSVCSLQAYIAGPKCSNGILWR